VKLLLCWLAQMLRWIPAAQGDDIDNYGMLGIESGRS